MGSESDNEAAALATKHSKKARALDQGAADVSWSKSVRLYKDGNTKKIKLTIQTAVIQAVICFAIGRATDDIILVKTWPEESSRNAYGKSLLLDACRDRELLSQHRDLLSEVKRRIKQDDRFAKGMSDLVRSYTICLLLALTTTIHFKVIDRLSITRSPAKVEAAKSVPYYQLGIGEGCEARVKSLFERLSFHLPGTWGGPDGNVSILKLLRQ
jgi:hypothetical protein